MGMVLLVWLEELWEMVCYGVEEVWLIVWWLWFEVLDELGLCSVLVVFVGGFLGLCVEWLFGEVFEFMYE